jgi:membrane protein required for beta-lactamase induction
MLAWASSLKPTYVFLILGLARGLGMLFPALFNFFLILINIFFVLFYLFSLFFKKIINFLFIYFITLQRDYYNLSLIFFNIFYINKLNFYDIFID